MACYIAIALLFIIIIFPESLNHSYLCSAAELVDKFKGILLMQDDVLKTNPQDIVPGSPMAVKTNMARGAVVQQLQQRE